MNTEAPKTGGYSQALGKLKRMGELQAQIQEKELVVKNLQQSVRIDNNSVIIGGVLVKVSNACAEIMCSQVKLEKDGELSQLKKELVDLMS